MRDQDQAKAFIEGASAMMMKQAGRSLVRINVLAMFFTAKSSLNASATPSNLVIYTIVMHVRDGLCDCTHYSYVRVVF